MELETPKDHILNCILSNTLIAIIGKRGTGKTLLTKEIVLNLRESVSKVAASSTSTSSELDLLPTDTELVDLESNEELKNFLFESKDRFIKTEKKTLLVIGDDNIHSFNNGVLNFIIKEGQECGLVIIIQLQYIFDDKKDMLSLIDYAFLFDNPTIHRTQGNDIELLEQYDIKLLFKGQYPGFNNFSFFRKEIR